MEMLVRAMLLVVERAVTPPQSPVLFAVLSPFLLAFCARFYVIFVCNFAYFLPHSCPHPLSSNPYSPIIYRQKAPQPKPSKPLRAS